MTCVPWPSGSNILDERFYWREHAIHTAATKAGYKIVVANESLESQHHPRTPRDTKELVILPFYNFTAPLYDLHPGECTHFCSTPFLWMPIWRSLRLAMDRQWTVVSAVLWSSTMMSAMEARLLCVGYTIRAIGTAARDWFHLSHPLKWSGRWQKCLTCKYRTSMVIPWLKLGLR